jgi:probable F420-dependent oxidoreductase
MKFGVSMFVTDYSITPGELAQAAEERGFESLWMPEHTHIPTSRKSPWPGGPNLPDVYKQTLDPFMALTAAAVVTKRIKLATGICLVVERDPIHTAKNVATLDYLSGGRFVFGVGGGWNAEEMANHGTVFKTRFALMRERIEAMKAIWGNGVAEYQGEYVKFEPRGRGPSRCRSRIRRSLSGANSRTALSARSRSATAGCRSAAGASKLWKYCPATGRWWPKPAAILTMCR